MEVRPSDHAKGACRGGLGIESTHITLGCRTLPTIMGPSCRFFVPGTRAPAMDLFVLILLERGGNMRFVSWCYLVVCGPWKMTAGRLPSGENEGMSWSSRTSDESVRRIRSQVRVDEPVLPV